MKGRGRIRKEVDCGGDERGGRALRILRNGGFLGLLERGGGKCSRLWRMLWRMLCCIGEG